MAYQGCLICLLIIKKQMKRLILITTIILLAEIQGFAQSYTITYEKQLKPDVSGQLDVVKKKDPALAEQLKKQLEERVIIKTGVLLYNNGISTYQENDEAKENDETLKIESPQSNANINVKSIKSEGGALLYKDIRDSLYLKSTSIMGKKFLIKDVLERYNWNLTNETKTIGNFACKKAIAFHKDEEITAWYTPSIPIGGGPDEYYGLPGLIIELTNGNTTYNALSVQETPDISLTKPSKGKEATKATYQKLKQDRMDALKQQFKN